MLLFERELPMQAPGLTAGRFAVALAAGWRSDGTMICWPKTRKVCGPVAIHNLASQAGIIRAEVWVRLPPRGSVVRQRFDLPDLVRILAL